MAPTPTDAETPATTATQAPAPESGALPSAANAVVSRVQQARAERDVRHTRHHSEFGRKLVGSSRFLAIIPSFGLFVAAIALTIATLVAAVNVTIEAIGGHLSMQDMLVDYIEYADFFLLSIVLYIMSIGLYSLFIDDEVELPSWLEIHDLDDLKEKLIGVIVVVMGVFFLGRLIHGAEPLDLLCMGIGVGAVIMALAYFVRHVMVAHKFIAAQSDDNDEEGAPHNGTPFPTPRG